MEQFTVANVEDSRWSQSRATKDEVLGEVFAYIGEWSIEGANVYPGLEGEKGLVMKSKAAHHAISVPFDTPLDNKGKTLVVQYEVKLQKLLDCGGAYIKLLTDSAVVSYDRYFGFWEWLLIELMKNREFKLKNSRIRHLTRSCLGQIDVDPLQRFISSSDTPTQSLEKLRKSISLLHHHQRLLKLPLSTLLSFGSLLCSF